MSKLKVVLTDYDWPSLELEEKIFADAGIEFKAVNCRSESDVLKHASDADGLIIEYTPLTRAIIEKLNKCKIVSVNAIGIDPIDLQAATDCGICVSNVPDYCIDEVSDHTIALFLSCARKIVQMDRMVKEGKWSFKMAGELYRLRGQVYGLVAFGRIARAVAAKAKAFGLEIMAYDPFMPIEVFKEAGVKQVESLEQLLAISDYVSIHTPRLPQNRHMIGEKELKLMKKNAYLINVGRGGIVDEQALLKALREGWIAGAGLDVLEEEPPAKENPLIKMDSVVVTPHAAFYSEEAMIEVRTRAAQEVIRVLNEKRSPQNLANKDVIQKVRHTKLRLLQ